MKLLYYALLLFVAANVNVHNVGAGTASTNSATTTTTTTSTPQTCVYSLVVPNGPTVCELQADLNQMKKSFDELKQNISNQQQTGGGATYVRYGRTTCPSQAVALYAGYVGGSHYTHTGGGSNYLCLPDTPQWGNYVNGFNFEARIYGTEYESANYESIFSKVNNGGNSLQDGDVPCARCFTPTKSNVIMIPARRECPTGWSMEYRGYLAAPHYLHYRADYICVDEAPEVVPGSFANLDGALFYAVEGNCGSLPCPPYVSGWELTCVVCSK